MRQTNMYLYGVDNPPEIPKCVCQERINLIEANLTKVLAQSIQDRDDAKKNYLIKAREFWTDMRDHNGGY